MILRVCFFCLLVLALQVPIMVLPGVFLGNAVAADSHHLLQYLGVTHVLNAAQVSVRGVAWGCDSCGLLTALQGAVP